MNVPIVWGWIPVSWTHIPADAGGNGTAAPHLPQPGDVSHSAVSSRNCATGYGSQVSSKTLALPAFRTRLKDALLSLCHLNLRSLWRNSYSQDSSPFPVIAVFSRERNTAVVFELLFFCSLPPDGVLFLKKSIQFLKKTSRLVNIISLLCHLKLSSVTDLLLDFH